MDLTTATPVEIDTILADIWARWYAACDQIALNERYLDDYQGTLDAVDAGTYRSSWIDQYDRPKYERHVAEFTAKVAALREQARQIIREEEPFTAEYIRRGGWTRFYSVQGGHIHSSMDCSTCNKMGKATRFGWLPEWSGRSEDEALAALVSESSKTVLCTVCFPSAPVEWTVPRQDDSTCSGSGKFVNRDLPHRTGYYSGNWATCEGECGQRQTVLKGGKIRKHKKP